MFGRYYSCRDLKRTQSWDFRNVISTKMFIRNIGVDNEMQCSQRSFILGFYILVVCFCS